eukprot:CAMPEP_0172519946 /NCGR_PEP_ID=MMETSP1066-20121228/291716_1 /TAXON_ID=671091 /ORGANISM="Coscinodiscus wailesii, Strain CCMP2513" /LENGTH=304 /DNA_ID=CAMNT_0013302621 /DNA_START=206 /DNA_END=1120 /DNA_ORIENTATION=-
MTNPTSWLRLSNRTAIITGAASGIGSAIAKSLSSHGCNVILGDVDDVSLRGVAEQCGAIATAAAANSRDEAAAVKTLVCNVTRSQDVAELIRMGDDVAASSRVGPGARVSGSAGGMFRDVAAATILVNCAGVTRDSFIENMDEDDFDHVVAVNLRGTFLTCKHFCTSSRLNLLSPTTPSQNDTIFSSSPSAASIINVGSVVGTYGNMGQTNYAASKGGVTSLTKSLAKEVGRYGVRANVVLPGFIDTPMTRRVPEKVLDKIKRRVVLGRMGGAEDVSDLVLFLASDRSGFITGESIECSGMASL